MEKKIDFTKSGGFPLDQGVLDFMQGAYVNAITALACLVGDNVILSGVENNGTTIANGFVCMGGEVLPFTGGSATVTKVKVEETTENLVFEDLSQKPVLITRRAKLDASGTINFSSFTRVSSQIAIKQLITALRNEIAVKVVTELLDTQLIQINTGDKLKTTVSGENLIMRNSAGAALVTIGAGEDLGQIFVRKISGSDEFLSRLSGEVLEMLENDVPLVRINKSGGIRFFNGKVSFTNDGNTTVFAVEDCPTSPAGLPVGGIWRDGNALKIV